MQAVCRICRSADRSATPLLTAPASEQCLLMRDCDNTAATAGNTCDDELLAPCRCRGTMRWVHRGCLEEWRHAAAPGSDSYLHCDMCKTSYRFKATWWRRCLGGEAAVLGYTAVVCAALVAVSVFVAAECRKSLAEVMPLLEPDVFGNDATPSKDIYPQFLLSAYNKLQVRLHNLTNQYNINMEHVKNAFAGFASLSLIQLLIVDGSVGLSFNLMFSLWRLLHYDFKLDYIISTVFVVIGMARMAGEVRRVMRVATARMLTFQIIDYHADKCE